MNPGDFVRYWFSQKYPIIGIVLRKWDYDLMNVPVKHGTYLYTVDIMENSGEISAFDIHEGDEFEVISEAR